jgi:hypothetical protein
MPYHSAPCGRPVYICLTTPLDTPSYTGLISPDMDSPWPLVILRRRCALPFLLRRRVRTGVGLAGVESHFDEGFVLGGARNKMNDV